MLWERGTSHFVCFGCRKNVSINTLCWICLCPVTLGANPNSTTLHWGKDEVTKMDKCLILCFVLAVNIILMLSDDVAEIVMVDS
jgi:hypothetical protein